MSPNQTGDSRLTAPSYAAPQSSSTDPTTADVPVVGRVQGITRTLIVGGLLLGLILTIQVAVGTYNSERSAYSDEAAHFMNGLLVRDYVWDGLRQNPIRFAEEYYLHYPKIAIGMWPPLFAASAGLFMLPGWPPRVAIFVLLALVNAWAAWRLYRLIGSFASSLAAGICAAMLCLVPVVVDLTSAAMVDLLILALSLEASYWLARFFTTGEHRHAVWFGVFSAMCCLAKGNGLAVVFLPPSMAIFTRRYDRLAQRGLYTAAAIVLVLAGPFTLLSYRLDSAIGDFAPLHVRTVIDRLLFYTTSIHVQLGSLATGLALLGFVVAIRQGRGSPLSGATANKAALAALVVSGMAFHLLTPHQIVAQRYIAMLFPPLLGLVVVGIDAIASGIRPPSRRAFRTVLMLAVPAAFLFATPAFAIRHPIGAGETADFIEHASGLPNSMSLIVSDELGEGAMVSEVARRHPMPSATVIRGSKLAATDDWGGHGFRLLYASPKALLDAIEDLHVQYLVMDDSPETADVAVVRQARALIDANGDRLERVFEAQGERRFVTYHLKYQSPGAPKSIEIALPFSLGRVLTPKPRSITPEVDGKVAKP